MKLKFDDYQWKPQGERNASIPDGPYALQDTKDGTWIGDANGPKVYDDYMIARIAAQVIAIQLGLPETQLKAVHYPSGPKRKVEDLESKMTTLRALQVAEGGIQ